MDQDVLDQITNARLLFKQLFPGLSEQYIAMYVQAYFTAAYTKLFGALLPEVVVANPVTPVPTPTPPDPNNGSVVSS